MSSRQRHDSLDMLRGFAILGILVMNIQAFSMPWPAYANPFAYGDMSGLNGIVYFASHVFFDTKFYSLFAMMFGAGLALMAERASHEGVWASGRHYRRMLFLAIVGLLHGFFIWYGDILFIYAVCGSVAWLFRRRRTATLLIVAALFLIIPILLALFVNWSMQFWPEETVRGLEMWWGAASPAVAADLAAYSGAYSEQLAVRAETYLSVITWGLVTTVFWHATGLMLLGMALYRLGLLTAQASSRHYLLIAIIGSAIGLLMTLWGLQEIGARDWAFPWTKFVGRQFNNIGAPFMALAYLSLLMLLYRSGLARRLQAGLQAVGRTALSNYLLQSLICTTVFYGHGLGLFGEVSRSQQLLVVFAIWLVQILLSSYWLRHFRQGPVEWVARGFSHLQIAPLRKVR
ncbi:DUF418 domain-containing protein [Natronospira bacteriovora]|uniref:DUF418 domain-containing protein n=1 Tax=Natronospira bacteriovora TaxID=3069753 RepID=A0ABU0W8A2_9GAMM|nr:DUF418 domain-containing protein [Natronospira sp. AB-CW4]MDQ2070271.1 DUF418 domain-containing protein [Natronospira sp. AB-CW4]